MGLFKKKPMVEPADFLALRAELQDVKARLDATEQEKAIIEARLASLDASTTALAGGASPDIAEINGKIRELEERLAQPQISPDDDTSPEGVMLNPATHELAMKLADLEDRLAATSGLGAKVAELEEHLANAQPVATGEGGVDPSPKLAEIEEQLAALARKIDTSDLNRPLLPTPVYGTATTDGSDFPPPPATGIDGDTAARLDDLAQRVAAVDSLSAQLNQLNARVSAQAEFGAQLSALRDRITQLQDDGSTDELRARIDELANRPQGGSDDELRARVDELANRPTTDEELRARVEEIANRPGVGEELLARIDEIANRPSIDEELRARVDEIANRPQGDDTAQAQIAQLAERVAVTDDLRGQLAELAERVAATDDLRAQVASLSEQLAASAAAAPAHGEPAAPAVDEELTAQVAALAERVAAADELSAQVAQLAERVTASDSEARQARELVAATEERLSNVSTELANQLSELGRDIDSLAQRSGDSPDGGVTTEVVEALRTGQVKLANEQARYEIAFRQDLATLAEQVRKAGGR